MAYVPNATTVTEPVESRAVESAALEFRTLKEKVVEDSNNITVLDSRITAVEDAIPTIGTAALTNVTYVQRLSGTDVTTNYTLTAIPASPNLVDIYINGVYQQKNTYTVAGSSLTFTEAPPSGTNNIEVKLQAAVGTTDTFTASVSVAGVINSNVSTSISVACSITEDGKYLTMSGQFTDAPDSPTVYSAADVNFPAGYPVISTRSHIGTGTATLLNTSYNELFGTAVTVLDGNLISASVNKLRIQWKTKTASDPSHFAVVVYFTATYKIA